MPEAEVKKEETKTPLTDQDEFDAAFAEASGSVTEDKDGSTATPSMPADEVPPAEDPPVEAIPPVDTPTPAQPDAALQQQLTDLAAENKKLQHTMSSWEGRIKAATERANTAEQTLKDLQAAQDKPALPDAATAEELSVFVETYPELAGPITQLVATEAEKLMKTRLGEVENTVKTVQDKVGTIEATSAETATARHTAAIEAAHSDYMEIYNSGKLDTWIGKQPSFMQNELHRVVKSGETQEVIDMFTEYKKEAQPKPSDPPIKTIDPSLAALEAVPASSGGPPPTPKKIDKNDFDGAWDEVTTKGIKK